jgi:hypothetical protein
VNLKNIFVHCVILWLKGLFLFIEFTGKSHRHTNKAFDQYQRNEEM